MINNSVTTKRINACTYYLLKR